MAKYAVGGTEIPWKELMPGAEYKCFHYEEGKFAVSLLRMKAGFGHEEHKHEESEYAYVLKGKAEQTAEGETTQVVPGDLVRFPPGVPHSARVIEDMEMIVFMSPPREDLR